MDVLPTFVRRYGVTVRLLAAVQIIIVLLIIAFGTYHLFLGNFQVSMATMPVLIAYYFLVLLYHKRRETKQHNDGKDRE